ncbi:hypothetical protein [Microvirga solisilvae]|uniref:hypothetical protein n=1 Tax=Microvirga solisilvae TaxID=2919498 RepID=UPI001FAF714A|nr:hypothetical protein [Microvirga solisilvae]
MISVLRHSFPLWVLAACALGIGAAWAQSVPPRETIPEEVRQERLRLNEKYAREAAERERAAKAAGTWYLPWVMNGQAHCPAEATPHGSLEKKSHWESRTLQAFALFVHDSSKEKSFRGDGVAAEIICQYRDGYELFLEVKQSCRFTKSDLPIEAVSETIPKPRNGSLTTCSLKDRSVQDCKIQCIE